MIKPSTKTIQIGSRKIIFQWTQNALKKCSWFMENKIKDSTRDDAYFSRTFLVFELTHKVFELGLLNTIKYFMAPNNLKLCEGLWNISFSAHNKFQIFPKWFGLKTKLKQTTEIKRKSIEERELTWQPSPAASRLPQRARRTERVCHARTATHPSHLVLTCLPGRGDRPPAPSRSSRAPRLSRPFPSMAETAMSAPLPFP